MSTCLPTTLFFASRPRLWLRGLLLCGLLLILLYLAAPRLYAATVIVTTTSDSGPGSLRQAIADAAPGDTITFAPSLSGQTIVLSSTLTIDKALTIDGSTLPQLITLSGNQQRRVLNVNSAITVTLISLVIADGRSDYIYDRTAGAGIYNAGILTLLNTTVRHHVSPAFRNDGAIYNDVNAQLFVRHSSFRQNSTYTDGGAIYNVGLLLIDNSLFLENRAKTEIIILPPFSINGGAIYNRGQVTVTNSTFISNTIVGAGGALANVGGTATILNSTFTNNSSSKSGGALLNQPAVGLNQQGVMTVNNSTFNGNQAAQGGGVANTGMLHLLNTIIANSTAGQDCWSQNPLSSNRNNLIESGNCAAVLNSDPNLGPLATYGGATWIHMLLPSSPALDSGDSATCLGVDQRGQARPVGIGCDIGAFEGYTTDPAPEIEVEGNGYSIANGALTPQKSDQTDFGTLSVPSAQLIKNFTIANQGTDDLTLLAAQLIDPSHHFTIVEQPSASLAPGQRSRVQIAFTARTLGLSQATVVISSNDSDEAPYTFTIQAYYCHDAITVNSAAGDGPDSVAVAVDNICPGGTITFAPALSGATIALSRTLTMTKDIIIDGRMLPMPVTFSGQKQRRVAEVSAGATVIIAGVTIADALTVGSIYSPLPPLFSNGAGLRNEGHLTLTAVTFKDNVASGGARGWGSSGALYNNGVLTITASTFQANLANSGNGGAIENYGQMRVSNSTFVANKVFHNAGGRGGAIYNAALLTITNSTFSHNIAHSGYGSGDGGSILNEGVLWIYHSTFSGNQVTSRYDAQRGGGIANYGTLDLYNTIIANSVDSQDCSGLPTTNINNLIEDGTCESAFYGDPGLGLLADHGGPTLTYDLVHGSAAIDAGDNRFCPATDQRGVARPIDGDSNGSTACDIGAVEAPQRPPVVVTLPPLPTRTPTGTPTPTSTPANTATRMPTPTPTATATPTLVKTNTPTPIASLTPTPLPTDLPTEQALFDVRVYVAAPTTAIHVGETITVVVTVDNRSIGCVYPVYELTLSQLGEPLFRFDSPTTVNAPIGVQTVYTLTATTTGVIALQGVAYGESSCGEVGQWRYVNGSTYPVIVIPPAPATSTATPTATGTHTPLPTATAPSSPTATATPSLQPTVAPTLPAPPQPGDGNGDQVIDTDDISACIQEIFDNDGHYWLDALGGGYPGTLGCDANQDTQIDAGDVSCTLLLLFAGVDQCSSGSRLDEATTATLTIASDRVAVAGSTLQIPITLTTNGAAVTAGAFRLHVDPTRLHFDPTDGDGDALPDAVVFALPPLMSRPLLTATARADTLDLFFSELAAPPVTWHDGVILTITLRVHHLESQTPVMTTVVFDQSVIPSLGSATGASIPVQAEDGLVQIVPVATRERLYLPLVTSQ